MATVEEDVAPLVAGDKLTRDEFLQRWEAMPSVKRAELIRGVVYMPSPLSIIHGSRDNKLGTWIGVYAAYTPGCDAANNATTFMLDDAPQPDVQLRILPECGGQTRLEGLYVSGAPELAAETCPSRTSYDLHQKFELYREAGVREYLAVLLREKEVRWHRLRERNYELLPVSPEGILRSEEFPGLWLHAPALLAGDMAQVLATLQQGIASPEHAAFVQRLRQRS
ncbi:MAG: Uma2 family endonuclease [Planctomycetia bacterium]|nr:Uma2 family endonuclease [Planctomycetia bacterium]